jgi:endonuclease-3
MPRRSPRARKPTGNPARIPAKAKPRASPGSGRKASRKKAVHKATGARATAARPGAEIPRGGHTRRTKQSRVASARAKRRPPPRAQAPKRPRGRFTPPDPARVASLLTILERGYPDARCALDFQNPLQLLIATILSAQCTDARVNMVTPGLFARYVDAAAFAAAPQAELEQAVRSTGFYRNKARAIRECCADIVTKHGGKVPDTLEDLTALRGVGRKTANVVLGNAFGIPGLVVDTHVSRLANRLGLTRESDAVKIEFALMPLVPRERWTLFSHWLILHGRAVCNARKPHCSVCPLAPHCPRVGVTAAA